MAATCRVLFIFIFVCGIVNGYEYIETPTSGIQAKQYCHRYGSNLVAITTSNQLKSIKSLIPKNGMIWIGSFQVSKQQKIPSIADDNCIYLKRNGKSDSLDCQSLLPFICDDCMYYSLIL